jgi:RNA polymerase sigma factor (sigma-70 family)
MIIDHLPQVELLARRVHRRCPQVELDDLISAGTVGLIRAVDRFDPTRNLKLKTLAEHRIQGALLDYLRQLDPLPRAVREFQKRRDAVLAGYPQAETPTSRSTRPDTRSVGTRVRAAEPDGKSIGDYRVQRPV